jgi:hypothetical protein
MPLQDVANRVRISQPNSPSAVSRFGKENENCVVDRGGKRRASVTFDVSNVSVSELAPAEAPVGVVASPLAVATIARARKSSNWGKVVDFGFLQLEKVAEPEDDTCSESSSCWTAEGSSFATDASFQVWWSVCTVAAWHVVARAACGSGAARLVTLASSCVLCAVALTNSYVRFVAERFRPGRLDGKPGPWRRTSVCCGLRLPPITLTAFPLTSRPSLQR